jgi:hypothetical protein
MPSSFYTSRFSPESFELFICKRQVFWLGSRRTPSHPHSADSGLKIQQGEWRMAKPNTIINHSLTLQLRG